MPIPGPGTAISINTIVAEFGGTAPHSLSEYYRGGGLVPNTPGNAAIPTSGQIAIGNFYGSANRTAVALTISGNTYNYDVYNNRGPSYVAGATDLTVTVNPGVLVGSTSTGTYAMLVPSAFNPGDTVTIVNNGTIQGMGGGGGAGGPVTSNPQPNTSNAGGTGGGGGNAVYVNRPVVITNNGVMAGGGGGGGGGAGSIAVYQKSFTAQMSGGGGGGGAGFNGGGGGAAGTTTQPSSSITRAGTPGQPGTSPAGGAGGAGNTAPPGPAGGRSGAGGAGGGRGAAGSSGQPGSPPSPVPIKPGGGGGGAGNYIVGNPFVTYPATGTRQGGVA
jgi:hypothetical protein